MVCGQKIQGFGWFFELLGWFRLVSRGFKEDLAGFITFHVTWKGPRGKISILGPPTVGRAGACREGYGRVPLPFGWRLKGEGDRTSHLHALRPEASADSDSA